MKAIRIIFAAALLCAAAFLTGCSNGDADPFAGTYDKWYKYNGSTSTILLGSSEDDSSASKTLKSVELYCKFNPTSGLIVAIQASKDQNVDILGGLTSTTVQVIAGGKKEYSAAQFGRGKWIVVLSAVPMSASSEPKVISSPDQCIMLDNLDNFKIQWKKVLANFLLQKLLGE